MSKNFASQLILPQQDGSVAPFKLCAGPGAYTGTPNWNRTAYAAAHVVSDPLAEIDPTLDTAIDWDATLLFRQYLWSLGFGVAEAMDTAQRGMGLDWPASLELIRKSVALAKSGGHLIASGAGTDHLAPNPKTGIDEVIGAYEMQCEAVEAAGSRVILMASHALASAARSADDYKRVYGRILSGLRQPAILHWLGEAFDPALSRYWGSGDIDRAMETCLEVIRENADKIDGIKISLLSAQKEIFMRRRLPADVVMYTGDDFNYPELIAGDERGHSHALLGIFDPIASVAGRALQQLGDGDANGFRETLDPTLTLSRHLFKAPTRFYKTGIVFLAYLSGHQNHFTMIAGQENARSTLHLAQIVRLASAAGIFEDPEQATVRARAVFQTRGVGT